ncbi:MAG TPA: polysaccharide deacetylase family protein [Vicinamibacterales bacterium]|nr:polysaccharide deacetylase family protein [Vicinamibacterales bacterium]
MRMRKALKALALRSSKRLGLFTFLKNSEWRRRRLLVLCYHGVSLADEHLWNPPLYISPSDLRARFELLRGGGYRVLPLDEAIRRLYARELPPRSVAVTFDDGYHDFHAAAWPLLREFDFPATVYLTTLRCERNYPVFNLVTSYMLWRASGRIVETSLPGAARLDLRTSRSRTDSWKRVMAAASHRPIGEKRDVARELGSALGVDYDALERRRMLTIMTPAQVSELAAAGLDVQLHTHSHQTPGDRELFEAEIARNRERIIAYTGRQPRHFCYPSGIYEARFLPWLASAGVVSATTCDPGLASERSDALLLPRLVDHAGLSAVEFEGWLSGAAALAPQKPAEQPRSAAAPAAGRPAAA